MCAGGTATANSDPREGVRSGQLQHDVKEYVRGHESGDVVGFIEQTGAYCWPTYFKVLRELLIGKISSAFLPSKKAWALVPFRVIRSSFYIYAVFCIKKSSWSAKPWSRIPQATAGTCRVVKCTRTKLCTIQYTFHLSWSRPVCLAYILVRLR
jgi:hypothetical protein